MEQGFIDILKKVVAEQGKETFLEMKKYRSIVNDYTGSEYRIERGLLLRAVEAGVSNALFSAEKEDIDRCMKAQQHILCEEQFMDNAIAWNIVFILAYVLRDITIKEIKTDGGDNAFDEAMGYYWDEQYDKAIPILETLAKQGHTGALYRLGACYKDELGVTRDKDKGRELIRKAAEQGYSQAQYSVGRSYINSKSTQEDYAKALEWFHKAADQGNPDAQHEIGNFYFGGYGVTQDKAKASEWFKKAAEGYEKKAALGDARAQTMLDKMKKAGNI